MLEASIRTWLHTKLSDEWQTLRYLLVTIQQSSKWVLSTMCVRHRVSFGIPVHLRKY